MGDGLSQLQDQNRQLDEANRQLEDRNRQLDEANRQLEDRNRQLDQLRDQLAEAHRQYITKLLSDDLCRRCGHRSVVVSNDGMRIGFALLFFNTFSDEPSGLDELKLAKFDGKLLKHVLKEVGYEVKLVFDSEEDEMLRELRAVEGKINASDKNVIVFFSTHGGLKESAADNSIEESEGESTATDNSSEEESEGKNESSRQGEFILDSTGHKILNLEGVLDTHLGNCKGKHILVGVDSCRGEKVYKVNEPLPTNRTILYSCMPGYKAYDPPSWGSPFVNAFCREILRNSDILDFVRCVIDGVSRGRAQVPEARTTATERTKGISCRRHSFS